MTDSLKCDVYSADSYCSWQLGLNENTNGLLRQYWPKSTVQDVIVNLNDRPRKKPNYKTPAKLMSEHMLTKAA
jgi:IS30 family transposase